MVLDEKLEKLLDEEYVVDESVFDDDSFLNNIDGIKDVYPDWDQDEDEEQDESEYAKESLKDVMKDCFGINPDEDTLMKALSILKGSWDDCEDDCLSGDCCNDRECDHWCDDEKCDCNKNDDAEYLTDCNGSVVDEAIFNKDIFKKEIKLSDIEKGITKLLNTDVSDMTKYIAAKAIEDSGKIKSKSDITTKAINDLCVEYGEKTTKLADYYYQALLRVSQAMRDDPILAYNRKFGISESTGKNCMYEEYDEDVYKTSQDILTAATPEQWDKLRKHCATNPDDASAEQYVKDVFDVNDAQAKAIWEFLKMKYGQNESLQESGVMEYDVKDQDIDQKHVFIPTKLGYRKEKSELFESEQDYFDLDMEDEVPIDVDSFVGPAF